MLAYINPVIISITIGLILSIVFVISLWTCHQQVFRSITKTAIWSKKHVFNWTCFFWIVNLVCMAFSAQNAGYIFGLYENTGLFLGIALDLLIIAFTQAMLAAKARGERSRAAKILIFIVFCCLLSTAGNLAHNLHTNIADQTTGVWFQEAIPYLVSTMPLFLIALAWVADLKVNPIASMDIEEYKANEKKHLDFLEIQINNREEQAGLEQRMIIVESLERRNRQLRKGKAPRSFRWPWESPIDINQIVANVADNMKIYYEEKIAESANNYQEKIEEMHQLSSEKQAKLESHIQGLLGQIRRGILQENEEYQAGLAEQYDQDISMITGAIQQKIDAVIIPDYPQHYPQQSTDKVEAIPHRNSTQYEELSEGSPEGNLVVDDQVKEVLIRYPIVESWLSTGLRSVSIQQIISDTGHSPKRVRSAANSGVFSGTRKKDSYRIDSVINWLKTVPLPKEKETNNRKTTGVLSDQILEENRENNISLFPQLASK